MEKLKEVWIKLKEHDYEVSNQGSVRRIGNSINLKCSISNSGYMVFHLYRNGVRTHFYSHILVAEYFIDKVKGKEVVNHKDGIKTNNNKSNLEWCTSSYNNKHALDNNLRSIIKGEKKHDSKLTNDNVRFIRKTIGDLTNDQVAFKFSVSRSVISNIRTNKSWRHIN